MNVLIDTHTVLCTLAEPKRLNFLYKRELVSPANTGSGSAPSAL
jgi:hypothetical protein